MLCPHCGPHGHVEQTGFGSEYETFYCSVCNQKYMAFPTGNGELSELVPVPQGHQQPDKQQPEP